MPVAVRTFCDAELSTAVGVITSRYAVVDVIHCIEFSFHMKLALTEEC